MKKKIITTLTFVSLIGFSAPILAASQSTNTPDRVMLENAAHNSDSQARVSNIALTYTADGSDHVLQTRGYQQWAVPQMTSSSSIIIDKVTADVNGESQQINMASTGDTHGCYPSKIVDVSTHAYVKVDHDSNGYPQYLVCPGGH